MSWRARFLLGGAVAMVAAFGWASTAGAERPPTAPTSVGATPAIQHPTSSGPRARAWALDAELQSGKHVVQLANVDAIFDPAPQSSATPVDLDGPTPAGGASASMRHPTASATKINWADPTASLVVQGGYAQATVTPSSASARSGVGAGSGSSFVLASKYLTWQQQQELTTEVADLNDALFGPLNARLQSLAPLLGLLGVSVPPLQEMTPLAMINVGSAEAVTSRADVASSPGFTSARAQAQLGAVQLFDGFITVTSVQTVADSQNLMGSASQSASATLGQVQIAGLAAVVDDGGLSIATNNPLARSALQPILDLLLQELAGHGVTLRFDETAVRNGLQEATALEIDVATPVGLVELSVGHAEAAAGPTSAPANPTTATPSLGGVVSPAGSEPSSGPTIPISTLPASRATSPEALPTSTSGIKNPESVPAPLEHTSPYIATRAGIPSWLGVAPPRAAAVALHAVFLLLLLGGLGTAVGGPMIVGFARVRRARWPRTPLLPANGRDKEVPL